MRYLPLPIAKVPLWNHIVEPYLSWHSCDFEAKTLHGLRIGGNQRDTVARFIYYFGVWEPELTAFIWNSLRGGDVFVDVGANIGYYSTLAARRVAGGGKVIAIEPSPEAYRNLTRNIALNGQTNVRAVNVAAFDRNGTLPFHRAPDHDIGEGTLLNEPGFDVECETRVQTLGEILTRDELSSVRMLKIDVEGSELEVLAGLLPHIDQLPQTAEIIVEVHPDLLAHTGKSTASLAAACRALGFRPYNVPVDFSGGAHLRPKREARPCRIRAGREPCTAMVFSHRDELEL